MKNYLLKRNRLKYEAVRFEAILFVTFHLIAYAVELASPATAG
jgi:hypothetical protein